MGQVLLPVPPQDLPLRADVRGALYEGRELLLASLYLTAAAGLVMASPVPAARPRLSAPLLGAASLLVALGRFCSPILALTAVPAGPPPLSGQGDAPGRARLRAAHGDGLRSLA
jgi:hypothetical protein